MNLTNLKQALVVGVVSGVLALIAFFTNAGTFFGLDPHKIIDVFGLAGIAAVGMFLTNLMTTKKGKFLGAVSVKDIY